MGKAGIAWDEIPPAPTAEPGKEKKTQWENVPRALGRHKKEENSVPRDGGLE